MKRNKKLFNNKLAKGLVSLITIVVLLSSILATSIYYNGKIIGFVVSDVSINQQSTTINIQEVNDIKELNQLNEGWYEIRNGYVFYLDTFNSYVPLYINVKNPEQQNGLFAVDEDGNIEIFDKDKQSIEKEPVEEKIEVKSIATTITGKIVGLEKVSGFAVKEYTTLDLAIGGYNKKEFSVGDTIKIGNQDYIVRGNVPRTASETQLPVLFKSGSNMGETLFGSKAAYLNQQNQVIITNTPITTALNLRVGTCSGDICKQTDGSYILSSEKTQTTKIKQPTFDISNPEMFKTDMGTYIQNTIKTAAAKKEEDRAKPLVDAANNWVKNPSDPKAKERFDLELKKWEIYQKTKDNLNELVSYLGSYDKTEQNVARDLIIQRRNDPEIRDALSSAASGEGPDQIFELNRLVQLEQRLSPLGAKVDYKTGEIIDKAGNRGWGLKADGTIDASIKGPVVTKEEAQKINEVVAKAYEQYRQQSASEALTQKDGKLIDNFGREVTLSFNSQTGSWTIANRQSPQTIKNDKGVTLTKTEFLSEINGQSVSVYKDVTGKLYDYIGKELTEGQVKQASKFGTIDTEIVYNILQGQINKERPVSAKIGNTIVPAQAYSELVGYLKSAGKDPKTEGDFTKNNPLVIKNEKGDSVALAYGFENEEGIVKGTLIQSNFKNGQPLLIKTTSEDGRITIKEEREFKEIQIKDDKGKEIRKEPVLVTKSWVKLEKDVYLSPDRKITLKTERIYEFDKDGRQISGSFTELQKDALNGEPVKSTIYIEGTPKYEIDYNLVGAYGSVSFIVRDLVKGGAPLSDEELKFLPKEDLEKINRYKRLHTQYTFQTFFANVERIFTEFSGLGYYATLFFDEDSLLQWRDNVDRVFATLYLGTEYWSSAICGIYLDGEEEGIAWGETPQGLAQVAAHIEAVRTEPLYTDRGREFIYKITFNVRNGDYDKDPRAPEEMNINVVLKGERTVTVFKQDQKVKRGSSFGKVGRNAIAKASTTFYNEVCLTFDNVPFRWKISNNEICNIIVESSGAPTTVSTTTTTTTTSGGAPESEINDF